MKILFFGLSALVLLGGIYIYFKPNIHLVTGGIVPVYKSQSDAMKSPAPKPRLKLAPGQRVKVIKSIDVKHYQIYEVDAPNGEHGYVLDGDYRLER
jgi:hypothetical protein